MIVVSVVGYQVSLTLLVPDPSRMTVTWNIDTATNSRLCHTLHCTAISSHTGHISSSVSGILMPFLHHPGVSHIANFTVSSQVYI